MHFGTLRISSCSEPNRAGAGIRRPGRGRPCAAASLALLVACGGDPMATSPDTFPVRFQVANNLVAPVAIAVDGRPLVGLKAGVQSSLTVPSNAQWLTWTSAKPMDARANPIQDDIGEIRIALSGINGMLDITNVIGDDRFITARIFNETRSAVSIGVYDGARVACAAELPAATDARSGYTQIGYYRLKPTTELRAYRAPSGCAGDYTAWPAAELRVATDKSGQLTLVLGVAP